VYVEEGREVKGMAENGEAETIKLMRPVLTDDGVEMQGDLSQAKFDVAVEVGPTSESKRQSTVRSLTEMMQMTQDPETLMILSTAALANIQGEGMGDINQYMRRKLVKMGVYKPTDEEAEELAAEQANAQPDPNTQYLQAAAKEAEAKSNQAQAQTVKTIADTEMAKAKTLETLSSISIAEQQSAFDAAAKIGVMMNSGNPAAVNAEQP
jgi:hypothetical protein